MGANAVETRNGKQRFGCQTCGVTFRVNPRSNIYDEARKEEILLAYRERSSLLQGQV